VRDRTAFEFREFQATWIGCAGGVAVSFAVASLGTAWHGSLTVGVAEQQTGDRPYHPPITVSGIFVLSGDAGAPPRELFAPEAPPDTAQRGHLQLSFDTYLLTLEVSTALR
jgi:hypothetical protein